MEKRLKTLASKHTEEERSSKKLEQDNKKLQAVLNKAVNSREEVERRTKDTEQKLAEEEANVVRAQELAAEAERYTAPTKCKAHLKCHRRELAETLLVSCNI